MSKKIEIMTIKAHEVAKMLPRPTDSEWEAIRISVAAHGVREPVEVWKDADGEWFLTDGITRREVVEKLLKDGQEKAENGNPIELVYNEFKGKESDILARVMDTINRRHLSSSQKAAVTIKAGAMDRKFRQKETGEKIPEPELDGDLAEKVALAAGTNRTYVFECQKLFKEAPKLLTMVANGEINIPEAKRALNRVRKGLPPFPEDGAEEGGEDTDTTAGSGGEQVFKDGLGQEVPPEFAGIFSTRTLVKAAVKLLKKSKTEIEDFCDSPGGAFTDRKAVVADVNNLVKSLHETQPHCICPYCSGTGKDAENTKKKCTVCKGAKFLSAMQFKVVPDDIKKTIPGAMGS